MVISRFVVSFINSVRLALLIGVLTLLTAVPAAMALEPNRAGLVVQHGDGTVLYLYVEFTEQEITGADLLRRSGLDVTTAGYSGLGEAVCRIEAEGCPADDCFCESYGSEAWFWRYHRLEADGTWTAVPVGPSSRIIQDGDVDGWIWSPGDRTPPAVTIEEIARFNNVQDMATESAPASTDPTPTAGTKPVTRGVEVDPTAGARPLDLESDADGSDSTGYLAFAAIFAVIIAAGGGAAVWRRRAG